MTEVPHREDPWLADQQPQKPLDAPKELGLDPASAEQLWAKTERRARFVALGVALIIASPTIIVINAGHTPLGPAGFLLILAAGIGLIVTATKRPDITHHNRVVALAPSTRRLAQKQLTAYSRAHGLGTAAGVGAIICSLIPPMMWLSDDLAAPLFLLLIAVGVYFIIYVNMVQAGFRRFTRSHIRLR